MMNENFELSEREIEILKLVATGLSNKEIAYQLKISPNTVKVHLKNIFSKIGVVSRTEAAMFAVRQGWVEAGNQATLETIEDQEKASLPGSPKMALSPLILGILSVGGFAAMIVLVVLLVNLAGRNNPQIVEIVVTPTPEPVQWELVTQMPEPKKSMAYAAVDNKIYIIGGETPNGISDRVDIYDTVTGQWSEGARKPTPVSEACGAYLGGKIIVAGGKTPDGSVTNVVEAYDVAEDRWDKLPELPNPLAGAGCVEYEGSYYLIGGWDGERVHSMVISYSVSRLTMRILDNIIESRAYFATSELNNQIFIIGGWDGKNILDDINVISWQGSSEQYTKLGSLKESRYLLTGQNVLDKLYIIGGINDTATVTNSLEFDPRNGKQRLIENPKKSTWYGQGTVSLGEYIYGLGGEFGGSIDKYIYRLRVLYTILLPIVQ
ncbi:MAG: hypothetical protein DDG59_11390 [Anaerolineae bacterium]|jgi:DNA-binding CsgD family transcriptional regulator|nr:MAG: hypothetical protein DDG59_11390 [Anaerolineae bacterium]